MRKWGATAAAERYLRDHGPTVTAGPFTGLRLPADAGRWEQLALMPMLSGNYEREIYPYLVPRPLFIDIGCAEGFYLVGMARHGCRAVGFEIDPVRRKRARELAAVNGVTVEVRGAFAPDGLTLDDALVLVDIEGAEAGLIPQHTDWFGNATVIVEFHHGSEEPVLDALEPTHSVQVVRFEGRDDPRLSEHRPEGQCWGVFTPR